MLDVDAQLRQALKAKNHPAVVAWRAVKAKIGTKLTEAGRGTGKPLTEAELEQILRREIKERAESNEYLDPGRAEHQENAAIIAELEPHLPKALSPEEQETAIRKAIAESGAHGPQDMSKVMGALKAVPGVDMKSASARVRELLQQG